MIYFFFAAQLMIAKFVYVYKNVSYCIILNVYYLHMKFFTYTGGTGSQNFASCFILLSLFYFIYIFF